MKVLHVIPKLVQGGAETLLRNYLVSQCSVHEHHVLVLFSQNDQKILGDIADKTEVRPSVAYAQVLSDLPRIKKWIREQNPDIVIGWMYHAAVLLPFLVPRSVASVAYVHNTDLARTAKPMERWAQKLLGRLARLSGMHLMYCGRKSRAYHEDERGYPRERGFSFPNGIPLSKFEPSAEGRLRMRRELGLPDSGFVFGCFGRFNPQKNWPLVLDAVRAARAIRDDVYLIAAGEGVTAENPDFRELLNRYGLGQYVRGVGNQANMAPFYDAIDTLMLASTYGEAFPLVLIEAIAMGKPAISTDLGASQEILEGLCETVSVESPERFKDLARRAASGQWPPLGIAPERFRERALERYGIGEYAASLDAYLTSLQGR